MAAAAFLRSSFNAASPELSPLDAALRPLLEASGAGSAGGAAEILRRLSAILLEEDVLLADAIAVAVTCEA